MPYSVNRAEFARLVEQAVASLPPQFAVALNEVRLELRDRPTPAELASVGLEADELLLGLYVGVPLPGRSVEDSPRLPDVIYVFQEDCEQVCDSPEQLVEEVRITVLHELGHHFGLDEAELDRLGYG